MKFKLGRLVATDGVNTWMQGDLRNVGFVTSSLRRHASGDWGEVCSEDKQLNDSAVKEGTRLLSSYSHNNTKIWIITEWDRSVTTILFPEEY